MQKEKLLFTKEHEWLNISGDIVEIGISDYATSELGDITYIEFESEEGDVEIGDELVSIESVKAASSIESPISGTIIFINRDLEDAPEAIAEKPYDTVLVKLKSSSIDTSGFLTYDAYQKICE